MKDEILKMAGVKDEKSFYKKFPTKESFMAKHGGEFEKLQWGGNVMPNTNINLPTDIPGVSALPQQQPQGFNFNNFLNNNQQTIQQGASALGQGIGYGDQQQQGGPSTAQSVVGKFGPWGAAISAVSQMGTGITDQSRSNVVGALGTTIFDPGSIWTNKDLKGGKKIIGGLMPLLGGYWAAQARNARRDQGEQLDELLQDAQDSVDQDYERNYVRPEDMVTTNNQLFPTYGTGTNILAKNGKTLPSYMNGNILPLWGGEAETLSHNPFLPGNGETVMFRGQSHDRSDGKGNTGIGINYGGNAIEVESGEPALQLKNGSSGNDNLVVYGNVKINDEFSSLLGDPDAKGKKFKSYVADLSEQEKKSAKILDTSTEEIDTMDVNTPYDKLKMSSMEANVLGSNMKLKSIADKKMNAAFLQQAINDDEEEKKLKITDDGDVKVARNGITEAQNGIVSDKDYDYLVDLYQKAMAQGEGPAVEYFQQEFSRLAPERAKSILANYPVTNYGKANNMTNAELQSNYDSIFGKRTRQYIPDKERELSDLGITPIEGAGIMPGEREVVTDINDPGYKRSALLDIFSQVAPYIRPSNAEKLDPRQLMGERFAIANNQLEPVQAQTYQPQLASPYEVSFQDTLNANRVDAAAAQRQYGYNPAAQSFLSAQQYQANQSVLGEQFRTNQALRDQVYTQNRNTLNDAQLKNLGIFDQQYQRQEQAKSNTKATAQGAISSIADKYLQNQLENRTLQTYENLHGYRFGNNMRAINMNAPYQFNIPTVGAVQDVDENGNVVVTNSEKTSTIRDAFGRPKGSRQTSETKSKKSYKNGSIVKEIHNL